MVIDWFKGGFGSYTAGGVLLKVKGAPCKQEESGIWDLPTNGLHEYDYDCVVSEATINTVNQ